MLKLKYIVTLSLIISSVFIFFPYLSYGQEDLDIAIGKLSEKITQHMADKDKIKIAIIPFPNLEQKMTRLGNYIAEELTTNLFLSGRYKIVERSLLNQVLDELKLSQTGVVNPSSAKELGNMTGVDALVTGTVADIGTYVAVNCRLIETESGEVFAAAKAKIIKDNNIAKLLEINKLNVEAEMKVEENFSLRIKVIVDGASIKTTPDIEGQTLNREGLGTILNVQEKKGSWYKIQLESDEGIVTGYIHEMLVEELEIKAQYLDSIEDSLKTSDEITVLEKTVEKEPNNPSALYDLGMEYLKNNNYDQAAEALKKSIELKPEYGLAHYSLGITYLNLKDNFSAREVWEKLTKIDPDLAKKLYGYIK